MPLSERDKSPKPSGWGMNFHHTDPQRHVPCVLGDMLAPRSADDIAPITPAAMDSVQQALKLLANLIDDRDLSMYLSSSDAEHAANVEVARHIRQTGRSLTGILRVQQNATDPRVEINAKAVIGVIEDHRWTPSVALTLVLGYLHQRDMTRYAVETIVTALSRDSHSLDLIAFLQDCAMTGSDVDTAKENAP
jgi:hypothetical protein